MKWSDKAVILSARKLGEHSAVISFITPTHGLYKGVDRGAFSKSKRGIYQPGNIVSANWSARLPEQMGTVHCELIESVAAKILDNAQKLAVMNSASALVEKVLMEREPHKELFAGFETLIHALCHDEDYLVEYVRFEFSLLASSGFGVDLERCAATGQLEDLAYVSPKSGRAVSREAGRPYHDKMLKLPDFLKRSHKQDKVSREDIMDGIKLCGYFIHERVFNFRNIPVPAARTRLITLLSKKAA